MKKIISVICFTIFIVNFTVLAQLKIQSIEKLILNSEERFNAPKFSPDGKSIFFTNMEYNGIWRYTIETKALKEITRDPTSGFQFCVMADAEKIAYRRTYFNSFGDREQEIIVKDLLTNNINVVAKNSELSAPVFVNNQLIYSEGNDTKNLIKDENEKNISVLGIENKKIILNLFGEKIIYDPYDKGSYIWPYLSNDKKRIVAYEIDRGTFIADLSGTIIRRFGRLDAASWTYDDKYLIFMNDKDDGTKIISSDIVAISTENNNEYYITNTNDVIELNPSCSPVTNKIVFNSTDGNIFLVTFSVEN